MAERQINTEAANELIFDGPTPCTLKRAAASNVTVAGGVRQLVAAVTGKKIRVVWVIVSANTSAMNFSLRSASTDKTGNHQILNTDPPQLWPYMPFGYVETASGEALNVIANAGAGSIDITVGYVEVT